MGNVTPLGQDEATQKQHELVAAIKSSGKFGMPQQQEGSNGPEYMFHCPVCIEDDGKGEGHRPHLRISKPTDSKRTTPFVGCRTHDDPAGWKRIKKAIIAAGIPAMLLGDQANKAKGVHSNPANVDRTAYAEFKSKPGGLGETNPIPESVIRKWQKALGADTDIAKAARLYLTGRGLTDETIEAAEFGLQGKRLILPIRGADGTVVSARYRIVGREGKAGNWRPFPHPKLKREDDPTKSVTYGPPTRLYGLWELVQDTENGTVSADGLKRPVWIVGGEFDRLTLVQTGELAVTGTSGEGALPRLEDAKALAGRDLYIVLDCDPAGRRAARKWAAACVKIGANSARVLDLSAERADGYDISDYFAEEEGALGEGEGEGEDRTGAYDALAGLADRIAACEPYELPKAAGPGWDELTDRRVAEVVADRYSEKLRWIVETRTWMSWDGAHWIPAPPSDNANATNAIVGTAREFRGHVPEISDGDEEFSDTLSKFLHQYLMSRHASVREHMTTMDEMRVSITELDQLPVLNTPNGVLDLTTAQYKKHEPNDMLRWITKGSYVPGGKFPEWMTFLKRVLPDLALRRYVQKLLGYSLLDGNPRRLLIFIKGGTSTGKSAFAETVMEALGTYAGSFNMSLLRDNQDEKPRADIVEALTQRIIFASETSSAWHLHADAIKRMTGGDTIKARLPHVGTYVERIPAFTPWVRTNAVPSVNAADMALDRRLVVIPFDQTISEAEEDSVAMERLRRTSGDAVITWAVRGLVAYLRDGLGDVPMPSLEAKFEFSSQLSPIHVFLDEICQRGPDVDHEYWTPIAEMYSTYENWAFTNGIKDVISKIEFGKRLSEVGVPSKVSNSVRYRTGIRIKSESNSVR